MTIVLFPPLLAAAEWIKLAIFLVAGFIWLMRKLYEMNKEAAAKQAGAPVRKPPAPPRPQPQADMPNPAAGHQADPLRAQVEEFLRRAGGPQREKTSPSPQQQPGEAVGVTRADRDRQPRSRPKQNSPAAPQRKQLSSGKKQRQSVAEHVAERAAARSQSVAEKTSRLGERIKIEDEQFDNQLKAKFDHAVGTLADSANPVALEAPPPPADTPARRIAEMLASPDGVRQAMILNEILRRPSDRW